VDWLTKSLSTPVLQDLNDIQHNQHAILDIFATSVVLISISIHSGDDPKLMTPTLVYRPVLSADFYSRILSLYIKQMMSAQAIYIYTQCVRFCLCKQTATFEMALHRTEMRMISWMCGKAALGIEDIVEVVQRNRLRWYGHEFVFYFVLTTLQPSF